MSARFDLCAWQYAHRGLWSDTIPENSPTAFRQAVGEGFGAECDVHITADGFPVVFHDFTLERMTGAEGRVDQTTLEALRALRLRETKEAPPTLAELLADMHEFPLLVELKSDDLTDRKRLTETVCALIADHTGPAAMMSFDREIVKFTREILPDQMVGLLTPPLSLQNEAGLEDALNFTAKHKLDYIAPHILDAPPLAACESSFSDAFVSWTVSMPEHLEMIRNTNAAPIFEKLDLALVRAASAS